MSTEKSDIKKQVGARVPKDMARKIEEMQEEQEISQSEALRRLLYRGMNQEPPAKPQSQFQLSESMQWLEKVTTASLFGYIIAALFWTVPSTFGFSVVSPTTIYATTVFVVPTALLILLISYLLRTRVLREVNRLWGDS